MTAPVEAAVPAGGAPPPPGPAPAVRVRRGGRVKLAIGLTVVGLYVLVALLAPVLRPHDPLAQNVAAALQGPSGAYPLGTDELGRDVLSRLMSATGLDLTVALLATVLPCLLGTVLGLLAGYAGGWLDAVVMRVSDLLQAFPTYILMIALVFVLGPGVRSLLIAFTAVGWVVYARLIRGEVARIRGSEYIVAAVTAGLGATRIMVRHVLPNTLKQTLVYLTSDVVFAVTALAAFSFLGFGVQQPTPEWGSMTAAAQAYLTEVPRLTVLPGLVISVLAFGFALLGDGLQDRMGRR
ncbi:ABC transporter permease [Actinomadura macrotermitis]|uniref:Glutathione transport system permease protein GsiD n=1 Tax=Actinomadura macrotermitis TaxID=2585200 RepID=A0A7K0C4G5_9ACTN|nr:ABC transporter permease [Actinomadura macrotermitis]MQY08333.1 Glutathione transport system permease protein GsiD [Actinomadura macrotermitis]